MRQHPLNDSTVPHPFPPRPRPSRALPIALIAPCVFTLCFLFVYPPIPSNGPDHFIAWPSVSLVAAGFLSWLLVIRHVAHVFQSSATKTPGTIAAFLALAYFLELLLAAFSIATRK